MRTDSSRFVPAHELWSSRNAFLGALRTAVCENKGFAAGKLGYSEQVWIASNTDAPSTGEAKFERAKRASARFHACMQIGVFPNSDEYLSSSARSFRHSLSGIDFLAVHESPLVEDVVGSLTHKPHLIGFNELEPNREIPYRAEDCYLPSLRNQRVLIITSPADLLVQRANVDTFTAVWRKTGCPWFYPRSVDGLAFTSLFDPDVRQDFDSSLEVLAHICDEIAMREFDVAIVGAGSLGIPIVHHVKQLGKIGLSLGGHLQVLFGVQGKRWREDAQWQRSYGNEAWIDMPSQAHPRGKDWLADGGAYW